VVRPGRAGGLVLRDYRRGDPLLPLVALSEEGDAAGAVSLLVLLLVQDGILMALALVFANISLKPRAWHFGVRRTRPWRTAGWAVLGFALMLGFEIAYIALLNVDESNVDELGKGNVPAALAVALAVIVVAPISEEFFFRAFFYRALRTRLPVLPAAVIDAVVFASLHYEGRNSALILPVIAFFGFGQCLVYERTGSIFAVIAVHAAFNTFATTDIQPVVALVVGTIVVTACVVVSRLLKSAPSPFGSNPRARPILA
jgi:membrane protease YdiL (CAAX protease family)